LRKFEQVPACPLVEGGPFGRGAREEDHELLAPVAGDHVYASANAVAKAEIASSAA